MCFLDTVTCKMGFWDIVSNFILVLLVCFMVIQACLAGIKTNCRACEDSPPPRHPVEVSEWRLGSVVFSFRIWIYVVCFLVILIYHQVETIMQFLFEYLWNYFFSLTWEKQVHLFQTVTDSDAVDDKDCCMLCLHICFFCLSYKCPAKESRNGYMIIFECRWVYALSVF